MGFWNYLGMACLLNHLFGKKKHTDAPATFDIPDTPRNYDPQREAELDERYLSLSERIDALDKKLDHLVPSSKLYADLDDDIELLRDELDELEDERDAFDDDYDDDYL